MGPGGGNYEPGSLFDLESMKEGAIQATGTNCDSEAVTALRSEICELLNKLHGVLCRGWSGEAGIHPAGCCDVLVSYTCATKLGQSLNVATVLILPVG